MQLHYSMAMGAAVALAAPAFAADASLKLAIPRLDIAEYHRPYVAVWVEKAADQSFAANLALWYDIKKRDNGGAKWLKDVRQWWRKSGRDLQTPVDGVSAATRAPGEHVIALGGATGLSTLPAGAYLLVVEAARENGGREVVRVPFDWPAKAARTIQAQGEHELGAMALELKP
jgi:hypothetical protein